MTTQKIEWSKLTKWYQILQSPAMRGYKAQLRRCKTLAEICFQPAYIELATELGLPVDATEARIASLAVIAGVLAHTCQVNPSCKKTLATKMVKSELMHREPPLISEKRFQQLLACKDKQQLFRLLVRIVKQVGDFNLQNFARTIYYWDTPSAIKRKHEWAFDYYQILPPSKAKGD